MPIPDRSRLTVPRWYRELICSQTDGRILEIGCGGGSLIEAISEETDSIGIGCDLDEHFSPAVRKRPEYIRCDGCILPFSNDVFHTVVLIEVVEHVAQPLELVKEVHRVLDEVGSFFLKTPNRWTHDLFQLVNGRLRDSREWHPNVMTHSQLERLLYPYFDVEYFKAPKLAPNQREKLQGYPGFNLLDRIPFQRLPVQLQPSIYSKCLPRPRPT